MTSLIPAHADRAIWTLLLAAAASGLCPGRTRRAARLSGRPATMGATCLPLADGAMW